MPIYPEDIIDPPPSEPARFGLVQTAEILGLKNTTGRSDVTNSDGDGDSVSVASFEELRWQSGVTFSPDSCAEAFAWSQECADDEAREKEVAPLNPDAEIVAPFTVYLPFSCSSFGFQAVDYKGRTRRIFAAAEQKAIEAEFWTGEAGSVPSLMGSTPVDADHVLNPNGDPDDPTPVSIGVGLLLMSKALADCGAGGRGMIHMDAGAGELAFQQGLSKHCDGDGLLITGRGDVIVIGTGYTGWGPVGPPADDPEADPSDPAAPALGTTWIYGTRLVAVLTDEPEIVPESFSEAFDRQTNTVTFYAENQAAAFHDGCCSFAVLVRLFDPTDDGSGAGNSDSGSAD